MALNTRLLGKPFLNCQGLRTVFISQIRPIVIQPRPAQLPIEESHDEKNMRLCRPQSPHLTIYKPQLTSMLSITHRFTGMMLGGYASTLALISIFSDKPMGEIVQNISHCYPNFFLIFKLGLIFPFTYHFFNGIRHLVWDNAKGLTLKGVYTSGYVMLLAAGVSGLALFSLVLYVFNILELYWLALSPLTFLLLRTSTIKASNRILGMSSSQSFHYLSLVLIWDSGKALTLKGVYATGYIMLLCSVLCGSALMYLSSEQKRIEREIELKRIAEEAKAKAEDSKKKKKK